MKKFAKVALGALILAGAATAVASSPADARVVVGFGIGGPGYYGGYYPPGYYGGYYPSCYRYYDPYYCGGGYYGPAYYGWGGPDVVLGFGGGFHRGFHDGFRGGFRGGFHGGGGGFHGGGHHR